MPCYFPTEWQHAIFATFSTRHKNNTLAALWSHKCCGLTFNYLPSLCEFYIYPDIIRDVT